MTQQYRIEIDTPYFDRGKTISAFALSQEGVEPDKFPHIFKPMFEIENKELMNIDEENKVKEFYIKSDINGIHTPRTNMVEINYLDMLKLMHSYAQEQVKNLGLFSVNQQRELLDWLSDEPDHNIRKSDIDEIIQDFKYYQSNCG